MLEIEPATGNSLEKLCNMYAVTRTQSIDWVRGYYFSPEFSMNGKLISIYTESDALLRARTLNVITIERGN